MIAITKSGSSITINGATYNVTQLKAENFGTEIRVSHAGFVILDRTSWTEISYNGVALANADALSTLATNLTS